MQYYEKTIAVGADDLDELAHVNNVRYVQWIQDISKEHWKDTVPDELKSVIWVVMSHHISYKGSALLGDVIQIRTYIAETRGATSVRMVEMRNQKTRELLVTAKTHWCLLNPKTFRPMRISDEISALFNQTQD